MPYGLPRQQDRRRRSAAHPCVPTIERTAKGLGAAIAADERAGIAPEPCRAPTVYLGMDGTGVPMRSAETAGRAGKQPDGSAKTREGKLAVCWTAEKVNAKGRPERDRRSVRVTAAIESAASRPTDAEPSRCCMSH